MSKFQQIGLAISFIALSTACASAAESQRRVPGGVNVVGQATKPGGVYQPTGGTNSPFQCNKTYCFCYSARDCFNMGALGVCAGAIKETSKNVSECNKKQ